MCHVTCKHNKDLSKRTVWNPAEQLPEPNVDAAADLKVNLQK